LESPEALHPEEDLDRTTLSASHTRPVSARDLFAATAVWGRNRIEGEATDAFLLEGTYTRGARHHLFARLERAEKSGEELALTPAERIHAIGAATVGYVYDVYAAQTVIGLGASVARNAVPAALAPVYGSEPRSYLLFVRVRPARMPSMH
jgi:hypothetical protein